MTSEARRKVSHSHLRHVPSSLNAEFESSCTPSNNNEENLSDDKFLQDSPNSANVEDTYRDVSNNNNESY